MIKNRADYLFYLECDKKALGIDSWWPSILTNNIWRYERLLRRVEYFMNCKKAFIYKPYIKFMRYLLARRGTVLGFSIGPNIFGPGLSIGHCGPIIVNDYALVGENCRIHSCVYIGTQAGFSSKVPKIGNNAYIGPGAKIFGDIELADDIAIGANAVVNTSFTESHITIGGVPARKISDKGSEGLIIPATEIIKVNSFSHSDIRGHFEFILPLIICASLIGPENFWEAISYTMPF
jgi:serine O-acetyltransferase